MEQEIMDKYELTDKGVFLFFGDVEDDICRDVVKFILEENYAGKHEVLTLIINSNGGSFPGGFSVIDIMEGSRIPVKTVGIGTLASMGLHMFVTGKKGERVLTPNTLIMSHQWSWGADGKEHELLATVKAWNLMTDMQVKHYKKHTGLKEKEIRKYLLPASDIYLSAEEAKKLGLCDRIREF